MLSPATVNPFYAIRARRQPRPVPTPQQPVYAKLPQAPINASPVPHLNSLYHFDCKTDAGDRSDPGNCGTGLIRDLLRFYRPGTCYDPLAGSGACQAVCRELGIYCWSNDPHDGFDAYTQTRFHDAYQFAWLHLWRQKRYSDNPLDLSCAPTLDAFLERYDQLLRSTARALLCGGKLAVLTAAYCDSQARFIPLSYHTKRLAFAAGLRQQCTDIIRFSHGASSSAKVYRSRFIPGLHDVCHVFEKIA